MSGMQTSPRRQQCATGLPSASHVRLRYEVREMMTGKLVATSKLWQIGERHEMAALIRFLRTLYPIAAGYQHLAREV